jgi:TolB protein
MGAMSMIPRRIGWRLSWLAVVAALALAPLGTVGADVFTDDEGRFYEPALEALAERGILEDTQCGRDLICPDQAMERWVMAVWLVRALDGVDPGEISSSQFADVDADRWWAPFVERLAELGVTKGCAVEPAAFCPDGFVTRGQMATFLSRAFDLASAPSAGFADTQGNSHESRIDALAAAGITAGCGIKPARFCPDDDVSRGQMGTFLARALGLVPLPPSHSKPAVPERIAFFRWVDGFYDVFVVDADGTNTQRLTHGNSIHLPGFYGGLAWSSDGTRLTFHGDPDGPGGWAIFVAQADGTGVLQVFRTERHSFHPSWSPDGRIIFITDNKNVVRVIDADGGSAQDLLTEGLVENPVWSPDGSRIAFSRRSPTLHSDYEIWVMDADGSNQKQLTDSDRWSENPTWSPDNTHIAFHSRIIVYDTIEKRYKSLDDSEIFVVNADDGSVSQLTDNAYSDYAPVWSPDGTRIAFHGYLDNSYDIFVMDSDGSNQQQLTDRDGDASHPAWSPDGTRIAFQSYGGILLVDADGDNLRHLTYGGDFRPVWWGPGKAGS